MSASQTRSIIVKEIFWIMTMRRSNDDRVSETEVWFQTFYERLIIHEISLKIIFGNNDKVKEDGSCGVRKRREIARSQKVFHPVKQILIFGKFEIDWLELFSEKKDERREIRSEKRWKACKKNKKRGEKKTEWNEINSFIFDWES